MPSSENILMVKAGFLDQLHRGLHVAEFWLVVTVLLLTVLCVASFLWVRRAWRLRSEAGGDVGTTTKWLKVLTLVGTALVMGIISVAFCYSCPGVIKIASSCWQHRRCIAIIEKQRLVGTVSVKGQEYQTTFDPAELPEGWQDATFTEGGYYRVIFNDNDMLDFPAFISGNMMTPDGVIYGLVERSDGKHLIELAHCD